MHARHYSPALGRFVQPDPDRSEANLYAYAANNPVTEMDPDGTCFIVCQLVIGAVIDTVVYFATTENASLGGLAKAVVGGAVESAINPFAKLNKVAKLAKAASKILGKIPKASRAAKKIAQRVAPRAQRTRSATSCALHSFDAGTLVTLADGSRVPIESIEVGDEVLAWDEATDSSGAYPITAIWTHDDAITGYVVIDGEAIATTPGHPFYTRERGWVEAGELRPGEQIASVTSGMGVVSSVTWLRGEDRMYDLTVDVAHSFFVGDGGWLAHNRGPCVGSAGGPGAGKDFTERTRDRIRARDNNTCVFCGVRTVRQRGPNQSQIDHSMPKKRRGNNTDLNAQNTCRMQSQEADHDFGCVPQSYASKSNAGASQEPNGAVTEQPRTKILVPLPDGSWHGYGTEGLWAEPVSADHFRVLNTPFFAKGLSVDDVVAAKLGTDGYRFDGVVSRSGHSTYRVIPEGDGDLGPALANLRRLGCTWEEGPDGLLAIDVPPESDIRAVFKALETSMNEGLWDFEEGHVGHVIPQARGDDPDTSSGER